MNRLINTELLYFLVVLWFSRFVVQIATCRNVIFKDSTRVRHLGQRGHIEESLVVLWSDYSGHVQKADNHKDT